MTASTNGSPAYFMHDAPETYTSTCCLDCKLYLQLKRNFGMCIESRQLVDRWCICPKFKRVEVNAP